jgi:hypothetical protein
VPPAARGRLNGGVGRFTRYVKNWQGGAMLLRWVGAGIVRASVGFRRVRGHADIPKLALTRCAGLEVPPATIKDIAVVETIKEGKTVYRRD